MLFFPSTLQKREPWAYKSDLSRSGPAPRYVQPHPRRSRGRQRCGTRLRDAACGTISLPPESRTLGRCGSSAACHSSSCPVRRWCGSQLNCRRRRQVLGPLFLNDYIRLLFCKGFSAQCCFGDGGPSWLRSVIVLYQLLKSFLLSITQKASLHHGL